MTKNNRKEFIAEVNLKRDDLILSKGTIKKIKPVKLSPTNKERDLNKLQSESTTPEDPWKDFFFVIVSWGNPYRRNDDEYAWTGAYEDKKEARQAGNRLVKRGPKQFIDWCGSSVKTFQGSIAFLKACKKVCLNPNMDNVEIR